MSTSSFTTQENIHFSLLVTRQGVPKDPPGGFTALSTMSFFVIRDGQPIDLDVGAISFSKVSDDPDDDGQFIALVDTQNLFDSSSSPFVTQHGDTFSFSAKVNISDQDFIVSDNHFASIAFDAESRLDHQDDRLSDIKQVVDILASSSAPNLPVNPSSFSVGDILPLQQDQQYSFSDGTALSFDLPGSITYLNTDQILLKIRDEVSGEIISQVTSNLVDLQNQKISFQIFENTFSHPVGADYRYLLCLVRDNLEQQLSSGQHVLLGDFSTPFSLNCITYEDLEDYPSCCNLRQCCSKEVLEAKIELATSIIENITCTKICPYEACFRFRINDNEDTIFFNPVTTDKLLGITSIKYTETGEEITEYRNLHNRLEVSCNTLRCGEVEICGFWSSYLNVPLNIKEAVILLALEKAVPGSTGINGSQGQIEEVEWEDFSITYTETPQQHDLGSTGFIDIDRLINHQPTSKQIKFAIVDTINKCCNQERCSCQNHYK